MSSTQNDAVQMFQEAHNALPNSNGSFWCRTCMPPEAISSADRDILGLVHQETGQNSKAINTTQGLYASFSAMKILYSSIASQSLSRR